MNSLRESVLWGVVAPKLKGICIFLSNYMYFREKGVLFTGMVNSAG